LYSWSCCIFEQEYFLGTDRGGSFLQQSIVVYLWNSRVDASVFATGHDASQK
jgi:hypothetical protein